MDDKHNLQYVITFEVEDKYYKYINEILIEIINETMADKVDVTIKHVSK